MTEKPYTPGDLVSVDDLDELYRAYVNKHEAASGRVDRTALTLRRRATEGRALARMQRDGETLYVRATLNRPGEPRILTTEVAEVADLGRSRRR